MSTKGIVKALQRGRGATCPDFGGYVPRQNQKVDHNPGKIFTKKPQKPINKTNDLILNLTPENVTQHSRIE